MRRVVILLATLAVALATIGATVAQASDGRQLVGEFCTNANALPKPAACISLSFGGQTAEGYTGSPDRVIALRPGVYWLSVNDNATAHDFTLVSPDGAEQNITGVADTPGWVTVKVNLTHGTWLLQCDPHVTFGMYVAIEVGGVGQVG
jgi:plastocyanin